MQVPASTARLQFRPWREDDLGFARALFGEPRVSALVGGPFDDAAVAARLAFELANQRDHGISYYVLAHRDGRLVGCCGLKPREPAARIHELGFYLLPAWWGQGLAVEAGQSVIAHAFDTLHAASLFAGHHPDNHGSKRALEKLGFSYTHHELYPPTGLMHPCYARARA